MPVFKVVTQDNGGTESVISVEFKDKKRDFASTIQNEIDFQIYPNPAANEITVKTLSQADQLMVYSISGELLISENVNGIITQLDVSNLSNGLYLMKIKVGETISTQKFSVSK